MIDNTGLISDCLKVLRSLVRYQSGGSRAMPLNQLPVWYRNVFLSDAETPEGSAQIADSACIMQKMMVGQIFRFSYSGRYDRKACENYSNLA